MGVFSVGWNSLENSSSGVFTVVPEGVIGSWLSGTLDGEISMAVCAERVSTGFRHLEGSSLLADQVTVLVSALGSGGFLQQGRERERERERSHVSNTVHGSNKEKFSCIEMKALTSCLPH